MTGQTDRQRSDSIGRTVLQTVAQKPLYLSNGSTDYQEIRHGEAVLHLNNSDR